MKYIDSFGIPALLRAIERHGYDNQESLSATTLLRPAWLVKLEKDHWDEIEVDVRDQLFMLFGQAAHKVLERTLTDGDFAEVRVFTEIDGAKVSGQFDRLTKEGVLVDFKFVSIWVVRNAAKGIISPDHEAQVNILAALIREYRDGRAWIGNGDKDELRLSPPILPEPKQLSLLMVARDWRDSEAERQVDYPPKAIAVKVPLWPHEKAVALLKERVRLHTSGSPTLCSLEERWAVPDKWAVMGKTRALRLLDSEDEVKKWAEMERIVEPRIEFRPGDSWKRCRGRKYTQYCPVAKFCKPFQKSLIEKLL